MEIHFGPEADAAIAWLLGHEFVTPEQVATWPTGWFGESQGLDLPLAAR